MASPAQVSLARWNNVRKALDVARGARGIPGASGIGAETAPIHELSVGREITGIGAF